MLRRIPRFRRLKREQSGLGVLQRTSVRSPRAKYWAQVGALAISYFIVARLGLMTDAVSGFATLVWPATGLALAALFLFGRRLWPGVWIGAALVNWVAGAPAVVACGVAVGNTLEAVLGVSLLRRSGFRPSLDRVRDVLALAGLAAVLATFVSATLGVASLYLGGTISSSQLADTWRAWWLGDLIAALVVAPVLLSLGSAPRRTMSWLQRAPEAAALFLAVSFTAGLVFLLPASVREPYLVFLPLIWAALRFGSRTVTLAVFGVSALATAGTVLGTGPYVRPTLHESLALLQAFMAVLAVTILILHAVTTERGQLLDRERASRAEAQDARQRFAFLASASKTIDSHLDCAALESLSRLAVSYLADWCAVDLLEGDRSLHRICVVHADPRMREATANLQRTAPAESPLPLDTREIVRDKKAVLRGTISEEWLERNVPDPVHRSLLRQLGIASLMHVPILAHGEVYGVISFARARPNPPFSTDDLRLAEDLARRAGQAAAVYRSLRRTEESRRLLSAVIEGTSDVVFAKDLSGRYLLINSAGARLLGRTPAEVAGKDDSALFSDETARTLRQTDFRILESGVAEAIEERIKTPDGDRVFWSTKAPFRDDEHVAGLVGIARDITDRKRAEETRLCGSRISARATSWRCSPTSCGTRLRPSVAASTYCSARPRAGRKPCAPRPSSIGRSRTWPASSTTCST